MKCQACGAVFAEHAGVCPQCGEGILASGINEPAADLAGSGLGGGDSDDESAEEEKAPQRGEETEDSSKTISDRLRETARVHLQEGEEEAAPAGWSEGRYSGKTMRGAFLLTTLVTLVCVAVGIFLHVKGWMEHWVAVKWGLLLAIPVVLWIYQLCAYIYRTMTIKYRLTTYRLYHEEGIFRRVRDVIEVIDIDDLRLEHTLWDRVVNGGVGTIIVKSADQSNPVLRIHGLEEPEKVFEAIDEARRHERQRRGLKAV